MIAFAEARASGAVPPKLRDELFAAIYAPLNDLAKKIVRTKAPARDATPISEEVVGRIFAKRTFSQLMARFNPDRGDAFSWFYQILFHSWIEWVLRPANRGQVILLTPEDWELVIEQMAEQMLDMPIGHSAGGNRPGPDDEVARKQEAEELYRAMQSLTPRQRDLLRLRHVDELSIKECARLVGVSESTVELDLSKASKKIRKVYEGGSEPVLNFVFEA
ncbi:MAG: sigma-70 family RNA polymerase sigma factor [Ramlibacter sp.]